MPTISDVRGYADSAVSQGRSVLLQVGGVVQGVTGALSTLISDAPPPSHLALGVADLAAEAVSRRAEAATTRSEHGPRLVDAPLASPRFGISRPVSSRLVGSGRVVDPRLFKARLTQRQEDAVAAIARAQEGAQATLTDVRSRLKERPARAAVHTSFGRARQAYGTINVRGEKRAAELAKDDRLAKLIADFDGASETVQAKVIPILDAISVRASGLITQLAVQPAPTSGSQTPAEAPSTDAQPARASARKVAAKRTTPVRGPGKATPAKKVPAKKPTS